MEQDHNEAYTVPGGLTAPASARASLDGFRERSLRRGVNPFVYWSLRSILVPAFLVYLRMQRVGREHLPKQGPLLLAANHRSFLDPFVIGTLLRLPVYYMAKRELFEKRWQAWLLNALGAFPVDRGRGDAAAMDTARAILQRGDCVVVFPEGTRVRRGSLGSPRRGVGRLALETGVPVAPVAVFGSEHVRRGWRIRPRKVRLRVGRPMPFPTTGSSSPALAAAVTDRIWACVSLQWEWLGGVRASGEAAPALATRADRSRGESAHATHPLRERISAGSTGAAQEKETRAA
ncbi:MAG TPA: lysophospholipid acyltransferase family protein [Solirubrobacteraceae bacterium]|nr:lysophospholipid acyltransferase family protein [Solirubrobacteraceae bacterium]